MNDVVEPELPAPPSPPMVLPLRATPPTRTRRQGLLLVLLAFLPAVLLPVGWFFSTRAIDATTAIALLVIAGIATIVWAVRSFWLPSSTSIVIDDEWFELPMGRRRLRVHLDELFSLRVLKRNVIIVAGVPAGIVARGHTGGMIVPRRCFIPPADGQTLVDELRARVARRDKGAARLALFDEVAAAQARYAKRRPLVTWVVTAVCALIFLVEASDERAFQALVETGGNLSTAVLGGEVWRLVTANLLHASWIHIAMNLAGLVGTGAVLERWLGRWSMVLVLFGSGVGGQLASTFVAMGADTPRLTIGISGAIFGLLGVLLVSTLRFRRAPLSGIRVPLGGWVILLVTNGAISLIPIVDIVAHVGGFVAGAVVGLVVVPHPGKLALPAKTARAWGLTAVAVTIVAVGCQVFALLR